MYRRNRTGTLLSTAFIKGKHKPRTETSRSIHHTQSSPTYRLWRPGPKVVVRHLTASRLERPSQPLYRC